MDAAPITVRRLSPQCGENWRQATGGVWRESRRDAGVNCDALHVEAKLTFWGRVALGWRELQHTLDQIPGSLAQDEPVPDT
jgi:hypothetical protein